MNRSHITTCGANTPTGEGCFHPPCRCWCHVANHELADPPLNRTQQYGRTDPASIDRLDEAARKRNYLVSCFFQCEPDEDWPQALKDYTVLRNAVIVQLIALAENLMQNEMDGMDTHEAGQIAIANAHDILAAVTAFAEHSANHWKELSAGGGF